MIDWTKSMIQNFEYYLVDPNTWKDKKRLYDVKSCSINRNLEADSLGSASISIDNIIGECYVREYLVVEQNNIKEKIPLGIFLIQTPSTDYDGRNKNISMDAYTPLLELKEKLMPLGYSITKGSNIMDEAFKIIRNSCRAPVIQTKSDKKLTSDFIANADDNVLTFVLDLINLAKYRLDMDELGRIIFSPIQSIDKIQPVYTFNDDNSSILYPEISVTHDIYGIPNVVEVVSSTGNEIYTARVINDNPDSPVSIQNRGREILYRETSPKLQNISTKEQIDEYAISLLKKLSSVEYTVSYTHGYCPVRVGDCVRLNYKNAEINNIKALVVSQNIECDMGCTVSETAKFSKELWK